MFLFASFALGGRSPKILLWFMSRNVQPVFSSSLMVSSLTFRSLVHLEFVFACGVDQMAPSMFSRVAVLSGQGPHVGKHHTVKLSGKHVVGWRGWDGPLVPPGLVWPWRKVGRHRGVRWKLGCSAADEAVVWPEAE